MTENTSNAAREVLEREYAVFLDRVELTQEGHRLWRELFFACPEGFRPLTMSVRVPPGAVAPPLVVYIHGGGWMMGHPNAAHPVIANMEIDRTLAAAGYAVAKISYRLSSEAIFPAQIHDCKAAIRYLRRHAATLGIDATRIAALGGSAGGHLALLLGLDLPAELEGDVGTTGESSGVSAVVNWYGVGDLTTIEAQSTLAEALDHGAPMSPVARLLGGALAERRDKARTASPITYVNERAAPCLIQHGTADRVVPVEQARQIASAFARAGVPVEFDELQGADHCFVGIDTKPILPRVVRFLDAHLAR